MPDLHTLVLFTGASIAMLVFPGPSVIYIVTRSLDQGRAAGLVSVAGVETGALVHIFAAAVGMSAVLASSATAYDVVRYAGAAYLVWLGVRKLRERAGRDAEDPAAAGAVAAAPRRTTHRRLFWQGVLVNVLNPKTAIFFLAFLPQFVDPDGGLVAAQILLLGALFVVLATLSDGAYALLAAGARRLVAPGGAARRRIARASGATYIALGVATALSGSRPATTTAQSP